MGCCDDILPCNISGGGPLGEVDTNNREIYDMATFIPAGKAGQDAVVKNLLRDEERFLKSAGPRELTQAVLYFRSQASKAVTPQARDFYLDRAHQFSVRAVNGGIYGVYGVQRRVSA